MGKELTMGKEVAVKKSKKRKQVEVSLQEGGTAEEPQSNGAENKQRSESEEPRDESEKQRDDEPEELKDAEQEDGSKKKSKKMKFDMETLGGGIAQVEGIMSTTAFESLPVSEPTKNALKDTGFTHMTEVRIPERNLVVDLLFSTCHLQLC